MGEAREIIQFHFTTWPDMGVPEISPVIDLMKKLDEYYESQVKKKS